MIKFNNPIAQAKIAGLQLSHVEIQLAGARPILRAHFVHLDANGIPLPNAPVQFIVINDKNGNHFDALFATDGGTDSLRSRLYKAFAATLATPSTIVADAIAVAQPVQDQPALPVKATVATADAALETPIIAKTEEPAT